MSAPAATEPSAHSEAPFVGLRPFDTSDAKWFFGREREIAALTRKLRASRFTAVVGPSGSGKSSIVRAGVVPLLQTDGWLKVIAKPGSAPLERLAAALSEAAPPGPLAEARRLRFEALLRASAFGLANVAETLRSEAPALFIVIDQFEEIFRFGDESDGVVQAAMKEEARAFIELLLTAGSREGGSTHICITMRSDYFGNCSSYVGLAEAVSASQFLVPLPLRAQMEESIRGPVAKAGSRIEEALIQRLLVDVVEEVDQLPLLQHTLRRLWETASGDPRTMHEQDYVAVGRISGSIDQKAEDIVEKLVKQNPRDLATMERVMKALSDLDERSRASRRRQNRNELEALVVDSLNMNPMDARKSLTRVLDTMRREDTSFLQIADEDDAEIDIGHEALIRSWKRLSGAKRDFVDGWLREERRDGDRWRGYVMRLSDSGPTISGTEEHSLRRWLRRSSLGKVWSARYGNRWDEVEDLRWRSRRMRQITWSAVACAVIVLVAIGYSVGQPHYAEIVAHGARLNALSLAHEARGQASDGNSRVAVLLSVDALQQVAGVKGGEDLAEPEQALVDALARPVEIARLPIGARAYGVAYSPDGRLLAATSSDRKAHVWRAESFQPVPLDESQNRSILTASFSPRGGAVMLTELLSRTVLLFRKWNAETGRPISDAIRESPCQSGPAFSADGAQIIASYHLSPTSAHRDPGGDGTSSASDRLPLCRWDATTGLVIERVPLNEGGDSGGGPIATGIHSVVWSPDGSRAVSLAKEEPNTDPNVPRLWDGRTGKPIGDLRGHGAPVVSAAFSADGSQIVTTSQDNTARVWEARTGQMIGSLRGHTGTVTSAAFSSDGLRIVTGSNDNTLRLWDATTFQPIGPPIRGHTSSVYAVAFSSDGRHVASGSDYKTVRVWDVAGGPANIWASPFRRIPTLSKPSLSPPMAKRRCQGPTTARCVFGTSRQVA
jgi:WD40 repeat protein